ncbi:MAG TPA: lysophospholipid acyltransferase family protein [Candidatus Binataceae bacterium]|nr:lysophospholipid acyltransferase family protein [Candidatus Binataceae bacterium]
MTTMPSVPRGEPSTPDAAPPDPQKNELGSTQAIAEASSDPPAPTEAGRRPLRSSKLPLSFKDRLIFRSMLVLLHALSLLPDFILYPLGAAGGYLAYFFDRRHVQIGLKNLEIAFSDRSLDERRRILRASYFNLGRSASEYIRLSGFFWRRLKRRVTYKGWNYILEARRTHQGRGVIVLTAHFGNFELLPASHAIYGQQIGLVHHTQRFMAGDALMTWVRERAGVEQIRKHSAARAVLRSLRDGDTVGIPFDQNAKRSEAIWVPFFGEPAATIGGLARIAMIADAPVVPAFLVRQPGGRRHVIEISPAIEQRRTGDREADITENTARFVRAIEDIVRKYPEQFLWTHRRYRTRPRGMAPVYDS